MPHNTTRLTPRPAAPPSNPVTQQTTTTGRHAQKSPNEPDAEGSQSTRQRAPLRPKASNPGSLTTQPPNRARTQAQVKPEQHPETANP